MEKILEITIDKGRFSRSYFSLTNSVDKFFEGTVIDGEKISPLKEAKIWAKEKGFTHLKVISLTLSKSDKIYTL